MHLRTLVESLPSCFEWKDIPKTGACVGVFNVVFLFFIVFEYSLVQLLATIAFYGVIASGLYVFVLTFLLKQPLTFSDSSKNYEFVSQASIQRWILGFVTIVNAARNFFIKCQSEPLELLHFLFICYIMSTVGGLLSLGGWIWLIVDFLFAITFIKAFKGIQVSDYVDTVFDLISGGIRKGLDSIPRYTPKE